MSKEDDREEWDGYDEAFDDDSEWEACWVCHGQGGWHDCGDETCCCLDPDEETHACPECRGLGRLPALPPPGAVQ